MVRTASAPASAGDYFFLGHVHQTMPNRISNANAPSSKNIHNPESNNE